MVRAFLMSLMLQIQIPSLLPVFTSLVALVIVVIWGKRFKTRTTIDLRLPPGPWKLPLIGNLHQLVVAGYLPHHCLTDLANKFGPIMHLKLGQLSAIVITSPELAQEVFKTYDTRPTVLAVEILSYNLSGIISSPYNDYFRQMRKICVLELLSAKRVQSFASIREEEACNLVQLISLSRGHPINLSEMIFSTQNSITARAALGKKCKYQQEFISLMKEITRGSGFKVPDLFPKLKFLRYVSSVKPAIEKIHRKMDRILDEIINDHKVKRKAYEFTNRNDESAGDHQENLVDMLLQLQESGELQFDLTTNHIKAVTLDMYAAGSETSATTTEWAMSELVRNPRTMEKAQAEVRQLIGEKRKIEDTDIQKLDYLKLVIKETLRLHPPAPIIPRQATQSCKISGYDIPTEARVLINAWAIGRDPEHWENADCFLPERFQGSSVDFRGSNFIPFGGGRRMCPGISFATAAVELTLCQLLYHFNWKLPSGGGNGANGNEITRLKEEELDMTESPGLSARRRNDLYAIAVPYIP